MMADFAKLYNTTELGQILVIRDLDDDGRPCIKTMFHCAKLDALATISISFLDDEDGDSAADHAFGVMTEASAMSIAKAIKI